MEKNKVRNEKKIRKMTENKNNNSWMESKLKWKKRIKIRKEKQAMNEIQRKEEDALRSRQSSTK